MPGSAQRKIPNRAAQGIAPDEYEFLYRTNDDSVEYYPGPTRSVPGFSGDNVCLTAVTLPAETDGMQCASGDTIGGPSYVDGVSTGGALLSQTPPDMGQTALAAATFRCDAGIVGALLRAGADPHLGPQSAIAVAQQFGLTDMATLFT